jgi:putative transposase
MKRRKGYASDVTDKEWSYLEKAIPVAKRGGRPRTADMREVMNGIFYIVRTGCQWGMLPHDFPPKGTVYHYFNMWRKDGTWEAINRVLRETYRAHVGRQTTPSAAIIDSPTGAKNRTIDYVPCRGSQTVKLTEKGGIEATTGTKR